MKKSRIAALILAASLTAVSAGCRANRTKVDETVNGGSYAGISGVAEDSVTVSIGEETTKNNTSYTLNSVIDSGYVKDGLKYIYLDVTIKNTSDSDYEANAINNFYLILDDSSEVLPGVLADNYAKQHVTGYEHLSGISANSEFNGYIGFTLDESINSFTVGFFPTADDIDDKSVVVYTSVSSENITSAPDGFTE